MKLTKNCKNHPILFRYVDEILCPVLCKKKVSGKTLIFLFYFGTVSRENWRKSTVFLSISLASKNETDCGFMS